MRISLLFGVMLLFGCSVSPLVDKGKENAENQIHSYLRASFLPENNYDKTKRYYSAGEVTEEDFDLVLEAAREIYEPILSNLGLSLTVNGDYSDDTVNAYCSRDGNDVKTQFFGGLAKHPKMTIEGFALVVCHELGHAVAGIPVYSSDKWAAVEGQSDYFATAACARKMFDQNSPMTYRIMELMRKKKPTPSPTANCSAFKGIDKQVCEMSLAGGLSLGSVLADLNDEPMPKYETPSKVVVTKTMEKHPPGQCRLDSYKAGTLCTKEWNDSVIPSSKSQETAVSCEKPRCWYKG
jgi:hypothetical protein